MIGSLNFMFLLKYYLLDRGQLWHRHFSLLGCLVECRSLCVFRSMIFTLFSFISRYCLVISTKRTKVIKKKRLTFSSPPTPSEILFFGQNDPKS